MKLSKRLLIFFCSLWFICANYGFVRLSIRLNAQASIGVDRAGEILQLQNIALDQAKEILQLQIEVFELRIQRMEPGEVEIPPSERHDQRLRDI